MNLSIEIYKITEGFPQHELYGITSQIRRSAVSVPSNVAEGSVKYSNKEIARFVEIALGSLAELDTQLLISKELGYLRTFEVFEQIKRVNALLLGFKKHLSKTT